MLGIIAYKGVLLLFGVFLAWETRNVHYAELNDSKNIGLAVYNILVFSALSVTAEFVLNEQEFATKRIFNNLLMYLCTSMVLTLVFLPKVYIVRDISNLYLLNCWTSWNFQADIFRIYVLIKTVLWL